MQDDGAADQFVIIAGSGGVGACFDGVELADGVGDAHLHVLHIAVAGVGEAFDGESGALTGLDGGHARWREHPQQFLVVADGVLRQAAIYAMREAAAVGVRIAHHVPGVVVGDAMSGGVRQAKGMPKFMRHDRVLAPTPGRFPGHAPVAFAIQAQADRAAPGIILLEDIVEHQINALELREVDLVVKQGGAVLCQQVVFQCAVGVVVVAARLGQGFPVFGGAACQVEIAVTGFDPVMTQPGVSGAVLVDEVTEVIGGAGAVREFAQQRDEGERTAQMRRGKVLQHGAIRGDNFCHIQHLPVGIVDAVRHSSAGDAHRLAIQVKKGLEIDNAGGKMQLCDLILIAGQDVEHGGFGVFTAPVENAQDAAQAVGSSRVGGLPCQRQQQQHQRQCEAGAND